MYEEKILKYMHNNSDTITVKEVNRLNIPRVILTRLVKKDKIAKVSPGLYSLPNCWGDEYFNLLYGNSNGVYSHLTALYFHDLCERVPLEYDITVKSNYGGKLRDNIKVHLYYVKESNYELGIMEMKSPQGRVIRCYNVERCLCDLIKCKDEIYIEYLKYAFNEYYKVQKHDTKLLFSYAKKLNVYNKVKEFMEIFL